MDDRRRAELLIVRIRYLALVVSALTLNDRVATPAAITLILTVAAYNAGAAQIISNKSLYERYGRFVAPVASGLDLVCITTAIHLGGLNSRYLYLLYSFVIIGTGYTYNRFAPTMITLAASLALDSFKILALAYYDYNNIHLIAPHATAHLAAALVASYIIAFRKQSESMRMKERKLSAIFECGTRFTSAQDLNQLLNHALKTAISETGAAGGSIMLLDANHQLIPEVVERQDEVSAEDCEDYTELQTANWVLSTGQSVSLDPQANEQTLETGEVVRRPIICVPLVDRDTEGNGKRNAGSARIIGTLSVYGEPHGKSFGREDLDLLRTLAMHASMGVVNARLYRELHDNFLRTLQSLARSLEARDPYTQGHSYRVSEIAQLVARELGLPAEVMEMLRNAALLHDIGKIGVPDSVLQKPGRLTAEERLIIETHPVTGENICRPLGLGEDVVFLIRHHQERLNGSGYPDQLPPNQQPLPLRILCAVDAFDAMSSDRPYRKALSAAERFEQLNRGAGADFDPVVVEVLKSLLASGELDRFYSSDPDSEKRLAA